LGVHTNKDYLFLRFLSFSSSIIPKISFNAFLMVALVQISVVLF